MKQVVIFLWQVEMCCSSEKGLQKQIPTPSIFKQS